MRQWNTNRLGATLLLGGLLVFAGASRSLAQLTPLPCDQGATGLGLALRRLPVTASVLYVTAHPDDENNAVLVALSRGRGLRTGLLTLTRGDGGQNAIGPELFEALGVLRTGELAGVHRYDGAEQYFSAAYEFGFSFSQEETLDHWGHEETLGDVVRVVRTFRPDVILTLPLVAPGHQHHTVAARLAAEAFRAAGDPGRFPDQIREGLRPWQARKIYQGGIGGPSTASETAVLVRCGAFDPLLGMSWAEFGSLARASHKSQTANQLKASPGEYADAPYLLVDAEPKVGAARESDILDGVDATLPGLARVLGPEPLPPALGDALRALEADLRRGLEAYDAREPARVLPSLLSSVRRVRDIEGAPGMGALSAAGRGELLARLRRKEHEILGAVVLAQGLVLEVTAPDDVIPGASGSVTARVWNQGRSPVRIDGIDLSLPEGWTEKGVSGTPGPLAPGGSFTSKFVVTVAPGARYSAPYWKRLPGKDRSEVVVPADRTLPWSPPEVRAKLRFAIDDVTLAVEQPALERYVRSRMGGERQKTVNVIPPLSVRMSPEIAVVPRGSASPVEFRVRVLSHIPRGTTATVRLELPPGWSASPREAPLSFARSDEEVAVRFLVSGPTRGEGTFHVQAVVMRDGREFREGYETIAYDHVEERHLFHTAESRVEVLDVRVPPGLSVGYVMGVPDTVPEALRQLGARVDLLSEADLAFSDLSRYSTILTGVRAYLTRPDLRSYHPRLMTYAENGGNLVVQYNTADFNRVGDDARGSEGARADGEPQASPFAPYPAIVTSNRITDETAPLEVLVPGSPVFSAPNPIGARDWQGWVQERGVGFLEARDSRYTELLSGEDPFPLNPGRKKGILVVARVGRGTWTYVGLGLYRQVAAGTPGAYRLLANLVSRPRGR